MTTSDPADTRHSALSLIDESVHRLRLAPPGTLPVYYVGALPFLLALLYFWTDQGHDPDAAAHGSVAALGLALLFGWMKVCQAVFTARLGASIRRRQGDPWTWGRLARLALVQTALQPSGLFVLSLAMLPAALHLSPLSVLFLSLLLSIPFGWAYAFYQNVTVAGDGRSSAIRGVFASAWRHSLDRPRQNHAGLGVLSLLALFTWINVLAAAALLPQLAHMFTGEENLFTRNGAHLFNTTFFAVTGALTYLALDPLVKAFYTLRCFYLDSLHTGEDLKSDLAAQPPLDLPAARASAALALALVLSLLAPSSHTAAAVLATPAPPTASAAPRSVSPPELERSIDNVLRRREFAWRTPQVAPAAEKAGAFYSFFDGFERWWKPHQATLGRWFSALVRKIRQWRGSGDDHAANARSPGLDPATLRTLLYSLIALLTALLGYLTWRHFRGTRRRVGEGHVAPAGSLAPDLTDDSLLATQLPEDEWLQLARELLVGGNRRLALRAFYLAVLAGLGERGLLVIARHKSNRDYLLELRRRARDRDEMQGAFSRNVRRFERVWYGEHPVDESLLEDFQADQRLLLG